VKHVILCVVLLGTKQN